MRTRSSPVLMAAVAAFAGLATYYVGRKAFAREGTSSPANGSSMLPPRNAFPTSERYQWLAEAVRRASRITGDDLRALAAFAFPLVYRESRGNPNAESVTGEYGLFQLKPSSTYSTASQLRDPATNFAEAMDYRHRLRKYVDNPDAMRVIDVVRGWSYPALAADFDESNPKSVSLRTRFQEILELFGYPKSYAYLRAFAPSYRWDSSTRENIRSALASIPVVS